ncbi:unnamed protein product [Triticum turgidum subsp. durum]|uniref:Transcription repressor n=1 Tax=Triticum turgidum subsp. durum TaxID=4567 RepID=A0A9R0S5J9_TRITD|nr:unnamed protein product [Triticum turgidum subsp. durum]
MPRSTDRRAMLGCFPAVVGGRRPPKSPPSALLNLTYDDGSTSTSVSVSPPSSASTSSPAFLDDDDADAQADVGGLSSAIASRRLSLAPPGRSNSIVDSSSSEHATAPCPFIPSQEAVRSVTMSTDAPRAEFLKSMLEMAEALGLDPRRGADRARMHDLLLYYIAINDSDTLRDILGAFTELLCILNGNTTGDGDGTRTTPPSTATADRATHR